MFVQPARQAAIAFTAPVGCQALIFEGLMISGWLYAEPLGSYVPDGAGLLGPVYFNYGLFGPYFGIELWLRALVFLGLSIGAVAVCLNEIRVRRWQTGGPR